MIRISSKLFAQKQHLWSKLTHNLNIYITTDLILSVFHRRSRNCQHPAVGGLVIEGRFHQDSGQRVLYLARDVQLLHLEHQEVWKKIILTQGSYLWPQQEQTDPLRFKIDHWQVVVVQLHQTIIETPLGS